MTRGELISAGAGEGWGSSKDSQRYPAASMLCSPTGAVLCRDSLPQWGVWKAGPWLSSRPPPPTPNTF